MWFIFMTIESLNNSEIEVIGEAHKYWNSPVKIIAWKQLYKKNKQIRLLSKSYK